MGNRCRSCRAEVAWARTNSGKLMPVEPDAGGNLAVWPDGDQLRVAVMKNGEGLATYGDDSYRAVSHFAVCPKADQHRGPR